MADMGASGSLAVAGVGEARTCCGWEATLSLTGNGVDSVHLLFINHTFMGLLSVELVS